MRRAVFLDRDGVLNKAIVRNGLPHAPRNESEFELLPDAAEACHLLRNSGFVLILATNQPDVGRGTLSRQVVEEIHQLLRHQVAIDDIKVCYHDTEARCNCRKPAPGLLLEAANQWKIDLRSSFMIGDRWRDIDAGHAAGCKSILIDYSYREPLRTTPEFRARSLLEAARWIMNQVSPEESAQ